MITLDKVKWGFIGCGEVTEKKSGPAFSMIRNSEVVAVMSRDLEKRLHMPAETIFPDGTTMPNCLSVTRM